MKYNFIQFASNSFWFEFSINFKIFKIQNQIKEMSQGRDYSNLKAVSYRLQPLVGLIYFVKAYVNDGKYAHLTIYKNSSVHGGHAELHSIKHDKTETDEIDLFGLDV